MNNNIIPEVFKAPLAFTALEIPYMIQQHVREKEQHETNIEIRNKIKNLPLKMSQYFLNLAVRTKANQ